MPLSEIAKKFVESTHPVYDARKEEWETNEACFRGGAAVREKLQPFQWETADSTHYKNRQAMAGYVNFAQRTAERFVGALSSEAPEPTIGGSLSFGTLGEVRSPEDMTPPYMPAEILWRNADRKGSSFTSFFNEAQKWSMATGHRWVGCEVPFVGGRTLTQEDEQRGIRPYFVSLSPLAVTNWIFDEGRLVALVISANVRRIVKDGAFSGEIEPQKVLYVAEGYEQLGPEHAAGGWWTVDDKGDMVADADGQEMAGDLADTAGEIPYAPLFYTADDETFSISGLTELSAIGLAYMNLSSAGDNDAIEGGGRTIYVIGGEVDTFNTMADVKKKGGRFVPVPGVKDDTGALHMPALYDSASVSASSAIESAIQRKDAEARMVSADELERGPNTSGEARAIEFLDVRLPRLSLMAVHRENCETAMIHFAEMRWGNASPAGRSTWKKKIDLDTEAEDWKSVFEILSLAGGRSTHLTMLGLRSVLEAKGVNVDDKTLRLIEGELLGQAAEEDRLRQELGGF